LEDKGLLLKSDTIVDATTIEAPTSTKNSDGARDPQMHQVRKGKDWHFGMKAHIGTNRLTMRLTPVGLVAEDLLLLSMQQVGR
jgi:IS5 family transposase